MMWFDLMEICSLEVTLFCVFVCKDLVHAAKKSFQSLNRECLVSGLEGCHLQFQEVGIPLQRLHCKADLVFLDRVSLVPSWHLFLVVSVTLKLIYFPFPFVFRVVQPALVRSGGVLPGEQAATLSPETRLLWGLRQALCWFAWAFCHI